MSGSIHRYFTSHRILTALNLSGSNTKSTCIGICTEGTRKGERCGQALIKGNWDEGLDILAQLDKEVHDNESLKEALVCAVEKLLCARRHQNQKWDVVEEWLVSKEIRDLLLKPSPFTKQGSEASKNKKTTTAKKNQQAKTPKR